MRPSASARLRRAHLILQSCGSRSSLAPIVFQEGRERVSCFIDVSWASSDAVHGRSKIGVVPAGKVVTGALVSSEFSAVGVVSLGFGVKVTVEVIATGDAVATVGEALEVAFPHGGQGLGADMALLALIIVNRFE